MQYVNPFIVAPGSKVKLKDIDPGFKHHHEGHKEAVEEIEHYRKKLRNLQELVYADGRSSLLICLQGMDTGGKDGTINHILGTMNPQGCRVVGFRQPSVESPRNNSGILGQFAAELADSAGPFARAPRNLFRVNITDLIYAFARELHSQRS